MLSRLLFFNWKKTSYPLRNKIYRNGFEEMCFRYSSNLARRHNFTSVRYRASVDSARLALPSFPFISERISGCFFFFFSISLSSALSFICLLISTSRRTYVCALYKTVYFHSIIILRTYGRRPGGAWA